MQNLTAFDTITSYRMLAVVLGFVMWLAYRGSAEEQEVVKKKKDSRSEKSLSASQRTSIVWGTAVVVCILCYVNVMLPLASSHHVYRGLSASSESDRIYHYDRVARNPYSKDSAFRTIIGRTTQALSSNQEVFMGANRQAVAQQLERLVQYITPFVDNHPREYRVKLVLVDLLNLMTALGSPRAEKAYTYAQDLVGYAPENPFGYLALAQVFINKGDVDGAVRTMETIQSIQPNSSNINSALNYIRGLKEETQ